MFNISKLLSSNDFCSGAKAIKCARRAFLSEKESHYFNSGFDLIISYSESTTRCYKYCNHNFRSFDSSINALNNYLKKIYNDYHNEVANCYDSFLFDYRSIKIDEYIDAYKEGLLSALAYVTETLESACIA